MVNMVPMSRRPKVQAPFRSDLTSSRIRGVHLLRPMNGVADRLGRFCESHTS